MYNLILKLLILLITPINHICCRINPNDVCINHTMYNTNYYNKTIDLMNDDVN